MKRVLALPVVVLMLCAFTSIGGVEVPTQKPGLWKITMANSRMPGGPRSYTMCQDAAFISAGKASADAHLKNDCTRHDLKKAGNTFTADMDCTMSGIHVVSHSVTTMHGDDSYHTEITSTTGKNQSVMTVDNQWLGACKAGQKVGVPIK